MTQSTCNRVSIRLKSGGHSFSIEELTAIQDGGYPTDIVVLTTKTTLVPEELFDAAHATDYLSEVGLSPSISEIAINTTSCNGMVAVMAINKRCYEALKTSMSTECVFSTPLLDNEAPTDGSILHLEDNILYVRVYNGGLKFAEAMECKSDADVLYYLTSINEVYNIFNTHARAKGETTRLQRIGKKVFKKIVCE